MRYAGPAGVELQGSLCAWVACTTPQGVATNAELLFKSPLKLDLRPVIGNDLLHGEEQVPNRRRLSQTTLLVKHYRMTGLPAM